MTLNIDHFKKLHGQLIDVFIFEVDFYVNALKSSVSTHYEYVFET